MCVGFRKRRINNEAVFFKASFQALVFLEVGVGGGGKKESWSQTFLKMDALCMLKFYSSLIGIFNVSQIRRNYWQSRDNVACL